MTVPLIEPLQPDDHRTLGRYRLSGRLGQGGMGSVFLGLDETGGQVAVKVINRELAHDPVFRARFRHEVAAARLVRPFCTAPVLNAQLDQDPMYVVTEYVAGPSLDRMVAETGPLTGSNVEALAVGVATALTAIHGAGVVHRDLKPANVLLSPLGPRVIDFGIARALDAVDGPTRTGQLVGTPSYMAPELFRGEPVTTAYDVFAWGCTVVFAATGRGPFSGKSIQETMYRILHEQPALYDLGGPLAALVRECLDKEPARRPTPYQMLERLTGGRPEAAQTARSPSVRLDLPAVAHVSSTAPHSRPADSDAERTTSPQTKQIKRIKQIKPAGSSSKLMLASAIGLPVVAASAAALIVAALMSPAGRPSSPSSGPTISGTIRQTTRPGTRLFFDDFSSSTSGWPTSGTFTEKGYVSNGYALASSSAARGVASAPYHATLPTHLAVWATGRFDPATASGQLGVWCWGSVGANDPDVRIEFLIGYDGRTQIRRFDQYGGPTQIGDPVQVQAFDPRAAVGVRADCAFEQGHETFTLSVNGHPAGTGTLPGAPPPYNGIGLVVTQPTTSSPPTRVTFTDFELRQIS